MRNYIGLANSFHDSAVAIVDEAGKVVFAEATERYLQIKRAINNPPDQFIQIDRILDRFADPRAELVLAQPWSENTVSGLRSNSGQDVLGQFIGKARPNEVPPLLIDQYAFSRFCRDSAPPLLNITGSNLRFGRSENVPALATASLEVRQYDHHLAHAATACYTSPFDEGACAVIDGYGEGRSYSCYRYEGGRIEPIAITPHPQATSLGFFYMLVCRLCGFGLFGGEEWKVMGLAAYGRYDPAIAALLEPLIQVDGLNLIQCGFAETYQIYKKLEAYRRRKEESALSVADLAHTAQKIFGDVLLAYLDGLQQLTGARNVALGGGCLLNSAANGLIVDRTRFDAAHVFSAPADDGNAIGAALLAWREDNPGAERPVARQSPYLGSEMSPDAIARLISFGGLSPRQLPLPQLIAQTAQLLAEGRIVGWVQGRAEFGPRSLGNRSILADPRSADVKERINASVKFREEFRPFAPAILGDRGAEFFDCFQSTPYMERALRFRDDTRALVPGVVHVDGTGRLQTVESSWNPHFYSLIQEFDRITGVPIVLNTSFNVMGKPIIHTVEDALAVFHTSGLDVLVIEDCLIEKAH